jgi:hypothetical protein
MDIDMAATALKEKGFVVGAKNYPTAAKDYSQIIVPLSDKIPASATIAETINKGSGKNIYAVIKAGEDNKITEILSP